MPGRPCRDVCVNGPNLRMGSLAIWAFWSTPHQGRSRESWASAKLSLFLKTLQNTYIYIHRDKNRNQSSYMAVDQNPCCRGLTPLLQTFVARPLLQTLVADLCVEYCSLQGACRGGVCRRTPTSVTNLCPEWPPKPVTRPMFLIRCHMSVYIYIYTHIFIYMYIYIYTYSRHMYIYVCTTGILQLQPEARRRDVLPAWPGSSGLGGPRTSRSRPRSLQLQEAFLMYVRE